MIGSFGLRGVPSFQERFAINIREKTRKYNQKNNALAAASLVGNFIAYFSAFYLSLVIAARQPALWPLLIVLIPLTALAGVRLYMLQHDTGHLSLFSSKLINEIAGYSLSLFTVTPFRVGQYNHNLHHTYVGNLEERDKGEIHTMTLQEWHKATPWQRLYYRLYRNPFVLIPLGGLFTYFIRYRWPKNTRRVGVLGVLIHNLLLLGYAALIYAGFGWVGIWVHLASIFIASLLGVFLVYLQHNFENTYWARKPELDFERASLRGSSCLDFGWVFDEAVANITKHDIHHLNASIPCYRLRQCHRDLEKEFDLRCIGFREALASFRLKLWDEETGALVPFPP